jgi:hypothetical protein
MEIATPPRDHIPRGGVVRRIVDTRYRFRVSVVWPDCYVGPQIHDLTRGDGNALRLGMSHD